MAKALFSMKDTEDKEFVIFSSGPHRLNQMAEEYLNVSNFKARGIKTKLVKIPPVWFRKNYASIDRFLFFCNPKEQLSDLVDLFEAKDIPNHVYRYL
jgi:hypothetical protein